MTIPKGKKERPFCVCHQKRVGQLTKKKYRHKEYIKIDKKNERQATIGGLNH